MGTETMKKNIEDRIAELHCKHCGEQAYRDTVTCPHTGEQVDAIVYCSTCSQGVCRTHGFEPV